MTVQVFKPGTVELKPENRERLASLMGVSIDEVKRAEAECDVMPTFCLGEDGVSSTDCFALPFPSWEKGWGVLVPMNFFVGYSEDEE